MTRFSELLALLVLACCFSPLHAAAPTKELSWSSVHLSGKHLRLVSPRSNNESEDLRFHSDGTLTMEYCSDGWCTGPLTVWKIEGNRLKRGYASSEGDTLIEFSDKKIVLRTPDGKLHVYSIVP